LTVRAYLPFIITGLSSGAVYALAALGLVLTYRTSGVFNFAHGAIGMAATYSFYTLRQHVPTAVAVALAIGVVAPLLGLVIGRGFLRRLEGAQPVTYVVASLGLLVALQGLAAAFYNSDTRIVDPIFPTSTYRLFDVNIGIDQTLVLAVAIAAGLGLMAFFRFTHLGLQTRAVVDDRNLAGMSGSRPERITAFAWMLGAAFAATSGILVAPSIGLDSVLLALLVVEAFGAAVIGGLRSFGATAAAAFGLGIAQGVATKLVGESGIGSLAGLPSALTFIALFLVLVCSRKGRFREVTAIRSRPQRSRPAVVRRQFPVRPVLAFGAVAAVLPPFISGSRLLTLTTTVIFVLVFITLSLLVGLSRQVSLAHAVFVVFGATSLSHLLSAGVPYPVALVLSALVMVPIGVIMAIPAIRLSGLFLALASLGFGILAQNLLFSTALAFGSDSQIVISRPGFLQGDVAFYYFALAVVLAGVAAVEILRVSRLGRILTGLADSPTGMESLGVSPLAARLLTFGVAAFLAGLAGGLLGTLVQVVNTSTFNFFQSLIWLTVLVAAGAATFGGSVAASLALVTLPAIFTSPFVSEWQPVAFGITAALLAQADNGFVGLVRGIDVSDLAAAARERLQSRRALERYAGLLRPTAPDGLESA
jgi:branched-subunit amino acid ABC-type transport system permease component